MPVFGPCTPWEDENVTFLKIDGNITFLKIDGNVTSLGFAREKGRVTE